ncbi:MAG: GTPase domain-containing protein [Anaerolineae bacterium]
MRDRDRLITRSMVLLVTSIALILVVIAFDNLLKAVFSRFIPSLEYFSTLLEVLVLLLAVGTFWLSFLRSRESLAIAHSVAIVGFPKCGKTTLITALFGEIFARRMLGPKVSPKGQSTIERVNADLAKLERGEALGPTTDQDLFAYRTEIEIVRWFLPQTYKVEFGDFPGDDSKEYVLQYGPWLHTSPFFKWVSEADTLVFIVDLGKYLEQVYWKDRTYVAEMSAALRAAWQNYVDIVGVRATQRTPVVLAFTKADLLSIVKEVKPDMIAQAIARVGFGALTPPIGEIDNAVLEAGKFSIEHDFSDLITYLKGEIRHFKIVYTSCFGTVDGRRLGLAELFEAVLPR